MASTGSTPISKSLTTSSSTAPPPPQPSSLENNDFVPEDDDDVFVPEEGDGVIQANALIAAKLRHQMGHHSTGNDVKR